MSKKIKNYELRIKKVCFIALNDNAHFLNS